MNSTTVVSKDNILASHYNNLRIDAPTAGLIALWGGATPPPGWLICNGASLNTVTYATLFAVIGYTFGGSGSSFNIPDMQQRFPLGGTSIGVTGGGSVTLGSTNLPSHTHSIATEADHQHAIRYTTGAPQQYIVAYSATATDGGYYSTTSNGEHSHGGATDSYGTGTAFNITPTFLALHYIIRY